VVTWFQVRYWKDSITLFEHALEVTENNYVVHNNIGFALKEEGRVTEAVENYLKRHCKLNQATKKRKITLKTH